MFEHATATVDRRHRAFFDRAGEVRQVWARRADGKLFYLRDGGVDTEIRDAAHAAELTCPYPGWGGAAGVRVGGIGTRREAASWDRRRKSHQCVGAG